MAEFEDEEKPEQEVPLNIVFVHVNLQHGFIAHNTITPKS
jgi:hypothetical protein